MAAETKASAARWWTITKEVLGWPVMFGLASGAAIFLVISAIGDSKLWAARRLENGARAYCESSDAERVEIGRKLLYHLPEGVRVEVSCTR